MYGRRLESAAILLSALAFGGVVLCFARADAPSGAEYDSPLVLLSERARTLVRADIPARARITTGVYDLEAQFVRGQDLLGDFRPFEPVFTPARVWLVRATVLLQYGSCETGATHFRNAAYVLTADATRILGLRIARDEWQYFPHGEPGRRGELMCRTGTRF